MLSNSTKYTSKPGRKRKPIDTAALRNARRDVALAYDILQKWDVTAAHFRISKAAAHRLANDDSYRPSQATIDKVLSAPRPQLQAKLVPVCPDCGSVHHARCHGNGGTAVVLAPGETVKRSRGPWQSKAKPEVVAMVRGLELCLERKANRDAINLARA